MAGGVKQRCSPSVHLSVCPTSLAHQRCILCLRLLHNTNRKTHTGSRTIGAASQAFARWLHFRWACVKLSCGGHIFSPCDTVFTSIASTHICKSYGIKTFNNTLHYFLFRVSLFCAKLIAGLLVSDVCTCNFMCIFVLFLLQQCEVFKLRV